LCFFKIMKFLVLTCKILLCSFVTTFLSSILHLGRSQHRSPQLPFAGKFSDYSLLSFSCKKESVDRLKYVILNLSSYRYLLCVMFPALRHSNIHILLRSVKTFDGRTGGKYLNYPRGPSKLQENLISKSSMSSIHFLFLVFILFICYCFCLIG